jgi:sigma-B regulation protein RsbU (phosphoserine phosphatase)
MTSSPPMLVGFSHEREIHYLLTVGTHLIGRADQCDLHVSESSISRQHAEIENDGERLLLRDLGSHNGTRVNGARVSGATEIREGDLIAFAHVTFRLQSDAAPQPTPLSDPTMVHEADQVTWTEIQQLSAGRRDRQTQLFQALAAAGDLLAKPRQPEALYEPILDLVESALGPERIFILLLEANRTEPVIKASRLTGLRAQDNMILSKTLMSRVIQEKASLCTADAQRDPRLQQQESIIMQRVRSALAVPLFNNEEVIGLLYADSTDPNCCFARDELRALTLLANVIAVAITNARYRALEEEKRRLDLEVQAAHDILQTILPESLAPCEGYELHAYQEPCFEVGGDLYDVRRLPDERLAVLVGDVTGKGLGAALLVSHIMSAMQFLTEEAQDPAALIGRLNAHLWRSTDPVRFATLFFGLLDPASGRLQYVNAGHDPPLLISTGGNIQPIAATGIPVGMLEKFSYRAAEVTLAPGDLLVLYSDGIPEAVNDKEEFYGEERLRELLLKARQRPLTEIVAALKADLDIFTGEVPSADDVTTLMIRRQV